MSDVLEIDLGRLPVPWVVPISTIQGSKVHLFGYALKENTGTAGGEVDLYDGTDNKGLLAHPIGLSAGQTNRDWFGSNGLLFRNGMFVVITGSISGSLFVHLPDVLEGYPR